jgi:hypothetical protein
LPGRWYFAGVLEELSLEEAVLDGAAELVLGHAGEFGGFGKGVHLVRVVHKAGLRRPLQRK